MLKVALALLVGGIFNPAPISPPLALRIARAVSDYAGYTSNRARIMDYEITDHENAVAYPGYITVQVMSNAQPIFNISINTLSGQVADFMGCYIFEYPVIRRVEHELGIVHRKALSYSMMMEENGCDKYVVLRRPGDEGRDLLVQHIQPSH
jgi:hypothetical protein